MSIVNALQVRKLDPTFTLIRTERIENGEERVLFAVDGAMYDETGDHNEIMGVVVERVWRNTRCCPVVAARVAGLDDWYVVEDFSGVMLYADVQRNRDHYALLREGQYLICKRGVAKWRCVNEHRLGWLACGASSRKRAFIPDAVLSPSHVAHAAACVQAPARILHTCAMLDTHTKLNVETVEFSTAHPDTCRVTCSTPVVAGKATTGKVEDVIAWLCEKAWLDSSATLDVLTELAGLPDWFVIAERANKVVAAVERDTAISEVVTVTATSRLTGHVFKVDV